MTRWSAYDEKIYEGTFRAGKKDGLWIYYHENGLISEIQIYKDNELLEVIKP